MDLAANEHCFVCGRGNPHSLKIEFRREDGSARARFTPTDRWEGYEGVTHGGILATLLDEAMIYAIVFETGILTMTGKMAVTYKSPARIGEELVISGRMTGRRTILRMVPVRRDQQDVGSPRSARRRRLSSGDPQEAASVEATGGSGRVVTAEAEMARPDGSLVALAAGTYVKPRNDAPRGDS